MVGQMMNIGYPVGLTPAAVRIGKCAVGIHRPHRDLTIIPRMTWKIQCTELNEKNHSASQPRSLNENLLAVLANTSQMKPVWPWEIKVNLAETPSFMMRVHSPPHSFCRFSAVYFMVLICSSCVCSWFLSLPKVRPFTRCCARSPTTSHHKHFVSLELY